MELSNNNQEIILPNWLEKRYNLLWTNFKDREFDFDEAVDILSAKLKDKKEHVAVVISELRKAGRIDTQFDNQDYRRRRYLIKKKSIDQILFELFVLLKGSFAFRHDFEKILLILAFLYWKKLIDPCELEYNKVSQELNNKQISSAENSLGHDQVIEVLRARLSEDELSCYNPILFWSSLKLSSKGSQSLSGKLVSGLRLLENHFPEIATALKEIDIYRAIERNDRDAFILRSFIESFSELDLSEISDTVLGEKVDRLLFKASESTGSPELSEVLLPREIIDLIIKILKPERNETIFDPSVGIGSILVRAHEITQGDDDRDDSLIIQGCEQRPHLHAMSMLNMQLHGIYADILKADPFSNESTMVNQRFDICVSCPPFGFHIGSFLEKYSETQLRRMFPFGVPPRSDGTLGWAQVLLRQSDEKQGRAALIMTNGPLFRSGQNLEIRRNLVKQDCVESVISLPDRLFYHTSIASAILTLRCSKPAERKGKILFVDSSKLYRQHPRMKRLNVLNDDAVEKVMKIHTLFKEEKGFAYCATIDEIEANDYDLTTSRYVKLNTPVSDGVDFKDALKRLEFLKERRLTIESKLKQQLKSLRHEK